MNSLNIVLSQFKEIYMLLMGYPSISGEDLLDYAKNYTWNLFQAYIDAYIKILIYEYTEYGLKSISRLRSQCANMTFAKKSRYNRLFQKVISKGGESEINYIKIFKIIRLWKFQW